MTQNDTNQSEKDTDAYKDGREKAIRRLGRRECSTEDLRRKLTQTGISPEMAELVVANLAKSSLVSDERFTKMLIRQQVTRCNGPRLIRQKLREQGISLSAEQVSAISSEVSETTEVETARALVARKYSKAWDDKKIAARASQALLRRGFSYDVISQVLRHVP